MSWQTYKKGFKSFLQLERSMSENTIEAYVRDLEKLIQFLEIEGIGVPPEKVTHKHLQVFIGWINELGLSAFSQARIISGIKAFYKYLLMEDVLESSPAELLESPKLSRLLPDVLEPQEVEEILNAIDLTKPGGERNKTIIEVLYGCGLRVSELVNLNLSDVNWAEGFIKVTGKGNKQRLVPIGQQALNQLRTYTEYVRSNQTIDSDHADFVFLNLRGKKLSRVSVFLIIKELAMLAGINKEVSPHTFRHSFATSLVEGGADLRAVQEMLGHSSITTTEIYTHLDKDYLRNVVQQFHPRSGK